MNEGGFGEELVDDRDDGAGKGGGDGGLNGSGLLENPLDLERDLRRLFLGLKDRDLERTPDRRWRDRLVGLECRLGEIDLLLLRRLCRSSVKNGSQL